MCVLLSICSFWTKIAENFYSRLLVRWGRSDEKKCGSRHLRFSVQRMGQKPKQASSLPPSSSALIADYCANVAQNCALNKISFCTFFCLDGLLANNCAQNTHTIRGGTCEFNPNERCKISTADQRSSSVCWGTSPETEGYYFVGREKESATTNNVQ